MSDALERLSPEDLARGGQLVLTHVHRYEFAAELLRDLRVVDLCCGIGYGSRILATQAASVVGVDIDDAALKVAQAEFGDVSQTVRFERHDAVEFLRSLTADDVDAVVCFEGLEHLPDPAKAIDELARLSGAGTRIVASLPNDRAFEEENPFHLVHVGYDEAMALFGRLGEHLLLGQILAEGSVILLPGTEDTGGCTLSGPAPDDLAWANHFVAVTNVPTELVVRAHARMAVAVRPYHNEYMRELEKTVERVYAETQRLLSELLATQERLARVQRGEAEDS